MDMDTKTRHTCDQLPGAYPWKRNEQVLETCNLDWWPDLSITYQINYSLTFLEELVLGIDLCSY